MTGLTPELAELAAVAAFAPHLAQAFASLACDVALVIDAAGRILRVAHSQGGSLTEASQGWLGSLLVDTVSTDNRHKIESLLQELQDQGLARRREVNLPVSSGPTIPVAFTALRLGPQGPSLAVGHDLRAVALMQQRFMRVQKELEQGYGLALRTSGRAADNGSRFDDGAADDDVPAGGEISEQVNEASRAAFAAWLRAERLANEGPATPTPPPAAGLATRRRKRKG